MGAPVGRIQGQYFEDLFFNQAKREGLLAIKNPLSCRMLWKGKVELLPSQLDYNVSNQDGEHGFFDCKCFTDDHFVWSQLTQNQIDRAILWNEWNVPSGFVVFFKALSWVTFFPGYIIGRKGPGARFNPSDGFSLGRWENFSLKPILQRPGTNAGLTALK